MDICLHDKVYPKCVSHKAQLHIVTLRAALRCWSSCKHSRVAWGHSEDMRTKQSLVTLKWSNFPSNKQSAGHTRGHSEPGQTRRLLLLSRVNEIYRWPLVLGGPFLEWYSTSSSSYLSCWRGTRSQQEQAGSEQESLHLSAPSASRRRLVLRLCYWRCGENRSN